MIKLLFIRCAVLAVFLATVYLPLQAKAALDEAMITFTFDDGDESIYSQVLPVLKRYSFPATAYVISGSVGSDSQVVTWDQLWSLSWDYKWEIGNHTIDHPDLTTLSDSEVIRQIRESRLAFENHGLINVTSLAYPYGTFDDRVVSLVQNDGTLYSGRASISPINGGDTNETANFNPWIIYVRDADYPANFDTIKPSIDEAIAKKSWLVLVSHEVVPSSNPTDSQTDTAELTKIVDYVYQQRSNIAVVTIAQGVSKMLKYLP